jgi:hypothetical protein
MMAELSLSNDEIKRLEAQKKQIKIIIEELNVLHENHEKAII